MQNNTKNGNPTEVQLAESPSPNINGDTNKEEDEQKKKTNGDVVSPIWNMFSEEGKSPATKSDKLKFPRLESIGESDEDQALNTEKPLIQKPGLETRNAIEKNISSQLVNGKKKGVRTSFMDLIGGKHEFDFKKIGGKSIAYDSLQLRKMRAIYGKRGTFRFKTKAELDEESKKQAEKDADEPGENKEDELERDLPPDATAFHKLIIHPDSKWKSCFDVWILFLVGYSCITNIYFTSFSVDKEFSDEIIFWVIEIFFYFDFAFSWFMGFRDSETTECVWSYKAIAQDYLKGWFIIDFVSIFPFQIFVPPENGSTTKLLRMPRMLRMGKLMDIKNVKRLMKSFQGKKTTSDSIIKLYDNLFMYKLTRLLIVLVVLTYFQGCLWFLMSKSHKAEVEGQTTWYEANGLGDYEATTDQLIVSLYFALTMLSTVGYGDMFPLSNLERVIGVLCMMVGVAVFSLVMGQFTEIHEEFQTQMADPDNYEEFQTWLLLSQRFRNRLPLPPSLYLSIDRDYCFYLQHDRNMYFNDPANERVIDIPDKIKETIAVDYLFHDLIFKFARFFDSTFFPGSTTPNKKLLYVITQGLLPRRFLPTEEDKIIYEEYQEVDEMYFIIDGFIGIGFSKPFCGVTEEPYKMVRTQKGTQTICDHYVVNCKPSQWTYVALEECFSYALQKVYLHGVVFEKYPDFFPIVSSSAYGFYSKWISKTISKERDACLKLQNVKRSMYNEVTLTDNKSQASPVPTTAEYRETIMDMFLQRRINKRMAAKLRAFTLGNIQEPKQEKPAKDNAASKLEASEIDRNFFPTFEYMTDASLKLNDGVKDFIQRNERKFISFIDELKGE